MRAKTQDENKNSFTERPHENEKKRALDYVEKLLEEARLNPTNRSEDIAELTEIHRLLNTKKYGLVWEEHAEKVEEEMKTKIPVFVEDESKKISDNPDSEDYNFLLEGDNLHSLHLLEKTHAGKIDVIYIDPPYNTGNKDFKYNDAFVDGKDMFSHSKWLSFMERRLSVAKRLLSDNGVIFVSIDDNEQAQLKLLMDEIYGNSNFLDTIIWERAYAPVNLKKHFSESHDYILAYAKDISKAVSNGLPRSQKQNKLYKNPDNDPRGVYKADNFSVGPAVQSNIYEITVPSGRKVLPPEGYSWRFSKQRYEELLADNRVYFGKDGNNVPAYKRFLTEVRQTSVPMTIWKYEEVGHSQSASQDLKKLFDGKSKFTYPKPVGLVSRVIRLYSKKDSTVLDFFAGSGTTGQAVTELNAEDGGNRKFILATNNENNIAEEVTYERMKRVSAGTEKYKAHPMNLKYFKTAMINKEDENLEKTLLSNVKTLIELQHGVDLSNSKIAVVVNRKEAEELSVTGLSTVYMRGLTHQMLDEELAIKFSDVKIIDIPETYFPLELKEAGF
ncbi:site-specific DNA-methyltransferase [Lactococcus lactis subsp. lactis]|uniref:site-specific DNA-methyltransferase n=1 Tax=Lactococcus lactis TaxID=1358 RepID=UPI002A8060A3|nr:site-specific DNA-methyltransferase [Lactococcus lactis]MDY4362675.1 site-specific DNA-methyltransferase [Lactococcus lactis subsp. lactis]